MLGYTKTPNAIYAAMPLMSEAELRCTMALIRETYGFHRETARMTFDDFEAATGMSREGVNSGLKAMKKRGFFSRNGSRSTWMIGCENEPVEPEPEPEPVDETVYEVDQNSLPSRPNGKTKQSTKLTKTVYEVDQNSLPSRPPTIKKRKIKKRIKERGKPPTPQESLLPPFLQGQEIQEPKNQQEIELVNHPATAVWCQVLNNWPGYLGLKHITKSLGDNPCRETLERVWDLWQVQYRKANSNNVNIRGILDWYERDVKKTAVYQPKQSTDDVFAEYAKKHGIEA